jgi:multisubunit Na+/H+ antiporter MnhB subunit
MDPARVRELALLSVSRGCGFAGLAIICFMIGLAGYPDVAMQTGAVLMMGTAAFLVVKADVSVRRPYKRTELWVLLPPSERPRAEFAQQLIGGTLREIYRRFAVYFGVGGTLCFLASFVLPA